MNRAWDHFALVIFGAIVFVYAYGVLKGLSLDEIIFRILVVGGGLAVVLSVIHVWLSSVFREKTTRFGDSATKGKVFEKVISGPVADAQLAQDGGSESSTDKTPKPS